MSDNGPCMRSDCLAAYSAAVEAVERVAGERDASHELIMRLTEKLEKATSALLAAKVREDDLRAALSASHSRESALRAALRACLTGLEWAEAYGDFFDKDQLVEVGIEAGRRALAAPVERGEGDK